MKQAIIVIAYERPDYLYVTLSGIFSAKGIAGWDVYVYFDGNPDGNVDMNLRGQQMDVLKTFPICGARFTPKGTGVFNNVMCAYREVFSFGYEEVLFIEEDNLVAVDALEYLAGLKRNSFFYSLFRSEPAGEIEYRVGAFSPHGFLITCDSFMLLDKWIRGGAYWGFDWPGRPGMYCYSIDNLHFVNYDGIFDSLGKKYDLPMLVPRRSLVAHFGLKGVNQESEQAAELNAIHDELFGGDRVEWLPRLVARLKAGNYSDEVAKMLFPRGFVYQEVAVE